MNDDALIMPDRKPVGWFEETIPVRGCKLSMGDVQAAYRELRTINRKFGEQVIASIPRESDLTDEQWAAKKQFLLDDAFRLTVSIRGERDQQLYGEGAEIFTSEDLPYPIKTIYFTNRTAYRRHANGTEPVNQLEVLLDFSKPALFDPNPLVSEATPNSSSVTINAQDMTYFRAVQKVVESKLLAKRTWYGGIHRNFAYDAGMWLLALPVGLFFATYYMDRLLPPTGSLASYRWAFFIYAVGIAAISYRIFVSYTKWAFPVNLLEENKDTAWKHRTFLAAVLGWIGFKLVDAVWETFLG